MIEQLLPVAGGSGIAGYFVGKAVRKIIMFVGIAIGFLIIIFMYFQSQKVISVNTNAVYSYTQNTMEYIIQQLSHILMPLTQSSDMFVPVGTFGIGFVMGVRK